jgi:hypothetical protein
MHLVVDFINHHSTEDLLILGFFVCVGGSVAGWIIDVAVRERGFGVVGNGILIVLGAVAGVVASQIQGPIPTIPDTQRIIAFSAAASALALLLFCLIKKRFAVV